MTAPAGPMDPNRLRLVRQQVALRDDVPNLAELLADRDHWHNAVRATAASRAAAWLGDYDDALACVDREAEIKRLRDRVAALSEARDSRLAPLRKALLTLARAVVDGDGMSAQTLAADVLDEEKAGTL